MAVVANHQGAATAEVAKVQKDNPAAVSMQSSKTNLSSVPVTAQVPQHPNVTFKAAKPTAASISSGGSTGSKLKEALLKRQETNSLLNFL